MLKHRWRTPFVSDIRFQTQTLDATRLAVTYTGGADPMPVHWVHVNVPHAAEENDTEDGAPEADEHACLLYDTFESIVDDADDDPSPALASPGNQSMIERDLWVYETNPVSLQTEPVCLVAVFSHYFPVRYPR